MHQVFFMHLDSVERGECSLYNNLYTIVLSVVSTFSVVISYENVIDTSAFAIKLYSTWSAGSSIVIWNANVCAAASKVNSDAFDSLYDTVNKL